MSPEQENNHFRGEGTPEIGAGLPEKDLKGSPEVAEPEVRKVPFVPSDVLEVAGTDLSTKRLEFTPGLKAKELGVAEDANRPRFDGTGALGGLRQQFEGMSSPRSGVARRATIELQKIKDQTEETK
ncbi:hypothetical protein A2V68_03135 [candidate division Kazan bacterium RBG_13_50_9]|uniref:Uncharacterized protein n=1 Tax=candidate division Kazan bacterium RBG_13_50_9 TaxID=1798535 RepID=A0A1F4NT96_UNCK3|nr:MAG: hypothetical protein A2V68_03135 [candidate division Kazan bacterium RBG_13_50_9]